MQYTKPLANLIENFQRLPGIGPKSAQRIAFHLLKMPKNDVQKLADSMLIAKETIKLYQIQGDLFRLHLYHEIR